MFADTAGPAPRWRRGERPWVGEAERAAGVGRADGFSQRRVSARDPRKSRSCKDWHRMLTIDVNMGTLGADRQSGGLGNAPKEVRGE